MKKETVKGLYEDVLDIVLLVGATTYQVAVGEGALGWTEDTLTTIAQAAAVGRILLRRIVDRLAEIAARRHSIRMTRPAIKVAKEIADKDRDPPSKG